MAKLRVVVAHTDDETRRRTTALLRSCGYDVSEWPCADELVEELGVQPPELLVVGASLSSREGQECLHYIGNDPRWRDTRVLAVLSDRRDVGELSELLGLGVTDFIAPPFSEEELLARVHVQLRAWQELLEARSELTSTGLALKHARDESENRRKLVDILNEVAGDFSGDELFHVLVRRVALALSISHCSLILARRGDAIGIVATAFENLALRNLEIVLDRYPEIRAALETDQPVLIENIEGSPLYADVRLDWAAHGMAVPIQSVIALPFSLDEERSGVFFLRTLRGESPLTRADVEFAESVVRAAVGAIKRTQTIESTRADKERLEVLALTDPLTHTHNRRGLMQQLAVEIERAVRQSHALTVLMIDLDHFKLVNDTYGHLIGDEVLRTVAAVLQREARAADLVARFGGEEFVVLLPETAREGAVALAERVRTRVAEQPLVGSPEYEWLRITISIGVATYPSPRVTTPEDVIALADEALYRAKAEGRNRVCT